MSKTTSHFALSPQGVPSRTKKQRPDPNRDFRAESHYGSAFFITSDYPFNFFLQFAISTSKPPAPVALEGRLCLSGKPHEYKRSLVWLNWPNPAEPGKTQGEIATTTLQQ